jgi:isopenicillin N synthase-like dioxygenase
MSTFRVPVVDITPYVAGGTVAERIGVAHRIDAACREIGFIQILGHGIPQATVAGLGAAIDDLFGLPLETKRGWIRPAHENRGYTAPKSESLALSAGVHSEGRMKDFFEAYNVGRAVSDYPGEQLVEAHYAENTWPEVAGFRERVEAWTAEAGRVARTMTRIFEDALGLEPDLLAGIARHPIEVLRMNNYALPEGTTVRIGEDLTGMGEHTDFGIVTILWADQVRGLQVLHGGEWHDVSPADDALLINLGDLTTRLTNEQWLSTLHRVKPPIELVDGAGTIRRRRSAAYFFDGDAEAVVGPLAAYVGEHSPALYSAVTVDEHIRAKLAGSRAGVLNPEAGREASRVLTAQG